MAGSRAEPDTARRRSLSTALSASERPTEAAVRDYLIGKGVEQRVAGSAAETVAIPLSVTKRGALAFARKP
jgi:hypothetical protein